MATDAVGNLKAHKSTADVTITAPPTNVIIFHDGTIVGILAIALIVAKKKRKDPAGDIDKPEEES